MIALRPARYYKPYSVTLQKFTHERYAGTEIPKDFSSRVTLIDPERSVNRDVLIYMNHPLRYRGETFYQAGFQKMIRLLFCRSCTTRASSHPMLPA